MVRVTRALVREARLHSRLLPPLLRAVPLEQAKQELTWIQRELPQKEWVQAVRRRSKLEPLQYILGSQPFGELDIICRKGVLIPRWETEEWVSKLASCLLEQQDITIVDACTGSGCIPLLLHHQLTLKGTIVGFDISHDAISLSNDNLRKYEQEYGKSSVRFEKVDVFDADAMHKLGLSECDIVVSNPPYIPIDDYKLPVSHNGVEKSVRLYEPSLALIGDLEFYEALVKNVVLPLRCRGFVFELGYMEQVEYTSKLVKELGWDTMPYYDSAGKIRAVVGWRGESSLRNLCESEANER